jgi:hypothetical protein
VGGRTQLGNRAHDRFGMVTLMLLAGASYALFSSLAQALGPRRPD